MNNKKNLGIYFLKQRGTEFERKTTNKKEITLKNDRYSDVRNINKKNHEYGLIILLLTCNDQRSKIHQKIQGKKRHDI